MKIISHLIKNHFLDITGFNRIRYEQDKKKRNRSLGAALAVGFAFFILGVYWCLYAWGAGLLLGGGLYTSYVLIPMLSLIFLFSGIMAAMRGMGILFLDSGLETLFAAPVSAKELVIAKGLILSIHVVGLGILASLPFIVTGGVTAGFGPFYYLGCVLFAAGLSLLGEIAGTIVGLLLYLFFHALRINTKFLKIVLSIALVSVVLVGSFQLSFMDFSNVSGIMEGFTSFVDRIEIFTWLNQNMMLSILTQNVLPALLFFLAALLCTVLLGMLLVSKYRQLYWRVNRKIEKTKKVTAKEYRGSALLPALLRREGKLYFSYSIYVMNTLVGVVLAILYTGAMVLAGNSMREGLAAAGSYMGLEQPEKVFSLVAVALTCGMSNTTFCGLSIEGENFQIMKTWPVSPGKILETKLIFQLILTLPAAWLCMAVLGIALKFSAAEMTLSLLFGAGACFLSASYGCVINLLFPKFDWKNPTSLVKQSAASMFGILGSMFLTGGAGMCMIGSGGSWIFIGFLVSAGLLLAGGILVFLLRTWGVKKMAYLG